MVELRPGAPAGSLLEQVRELQTRFRNSMTALNLESAQRYFIVGVETLESMFGHSFVDGSWYERLYSPAYFAIREITPNTARGRALVAWRLVGSCGGWKTSSGN